MVTPVALIPIIRLPQRPLPALRGVVEIGSFAIGKDRLGPCLTTLFKEQGVWLKNIHLDNIAKIRFLGMHPSLEERAVGNATGESIFSHLELSGFLTQDWKQLYILGDKGNIDLLKEVAAPTPRPRTFDRFDIAVRDMQGQMRGQRIPESQLIPEAPTAVTEPVLKEKLLAGPYTVEILDSHPSNFTLRINNVQAWFEPGPLSNAGPSPGASSDEISLTAKLATNDIVYFSDVERGAALGRELKNIISFSWEDTRDLSRGGWSISWYVKDLNLRQIVEALPLEFEPIRLELLKRMDGNERPAEQSPQDQDALAIEINEMVRKAVWEDGLRPIEIAGKIRENEANIYPNDLNKKAIFLAGLITMINDVSYSDGSIVTFDQLIRAIVDNIDTPQNAALIGKIIGRLAISEDDKFAHLLKVMDVISYRNKGIAMGAAGLDKPRYIAQSITNDMTEKHIDALMDGMESFSIGDKDK